MIDVPAAADETPKAAQVTSGDYDEYNIAWTPDGSRIYYLTSHVDEPYYETASTELYSIPSSGGTAEKLTTVPMGIGDLVISPDGRRVAFHGSVAHPVRSVFAARPLGDGSCAECAAENLTAEL